MTKNINKTSPTVSFLLSVLRFSLGTIDKEEIEKACQNTVDWNVFNILIEHHKIGSIVQNKSGNLARDCVPITTQKTLKKIHTANTAANLLLSAKIIDIFQVFQTNEIPVLLIKGLAVENWLYKTPGTRSSGDIDLLINPKDWKSALTCMESMGYQMNSISERLVPNSQLSKQFLKTQKDVAFYHSSNNLLVELHWRFSPNHNVFPLSFERAWNSRKNFNIRGESLQSLSEEMHAIYLCYHGSKHRWERLFWLYDIAKLMLNDKLNWKAVLKLAQQLNAKHSLGFALVLASRIFLIPIPQTIKQNDDIIKLGEKLSDDLLHKILSDQPVASSANLLSICQRVSWKSRISPLKTSFLSEWLHVFTSPSLRDWESIKLPNRLTPLYRVLRPIRLIIKHINKSK